MLEFEPVLRIPVLCSCTGFQATLAGLLLISE